MTAISGTTQALLYLLHTILVTDLTYCIIVVVSQLLKRRNVLGSKKHNVRHPLVIMVPEDILCIQVWGAAMVDESSDVAALCSIYCEAHRLLHCLRGRRF